MSINLLFQVQQLFRGPTYTLHYITERMVRYINTIYIDTSIRQVSWPSALLGSWNSDGWCWWYNRLSVTSLLSACLTKAPRRGGEEGGEKTRIHYTEVRLRTERLHWLGWGNETSLQLWRMYDTVTDNFTRLYLSDPVLIRDINR